MLNAKYLLYFFFFFFHFVLDVCIVIILLFFRVLLVIFMSPLSPHPLRMGDGYRCAPMSIYLGNEFCFSFQLESWSSSENFENWRVTLVLYRSRKCKKVEVDVVGSSYLFRVFWFFFLYIFFSRTYSYLWTAWVYANCCVVESFSVFR